MTEWTMTDPESGHSLGEQALHDRRRQFWRMVRNALLASLGVGVLIGLVVGVSVALNERGGADVRWVLWPVSAAALVGFAQFTRYYFTRVDELDLQDNLWSSLIGLYFFICAMPGWAMMHRVGQAPPVDAWWLWGATLIVTAAAYGWRKWQGLRG